jgi:hypothetical protein
MRKAMLIVFVLITIFFSGNLFGQQGWAIGGEFAIDWGQTAYATGAALCVKFPRIPIMFGFSANLATPLVIGVTADWWLYQSHLVGPVNIYIGPGAFLTFNTSGGDNSLHLGLRIPFGFQIFIIKAFEIFLEPALAMELVPKLPDFRLQAALGFRFWF